MDPNKPVKPHHTLGEVIEYIEGKIFQKKKMYAFFFFTACFMVITVCGFILFICLQVLPILKDISKNQSDMNKFLQQPVVLMKEPIAPPFPLGMQPGLLVDSKGRPIK